jgi:hypothetical protein
MDKYYFTHMENPKPQKFDIIAVSIPDSNIQMAVARIMVGADKYLSMQAALERVKTPPVLLFKNTELKDAEQHIAKLKALSVGFRIVQADGTEDDSILRIDEPPEAVAAAEEPQNAEDAAIAGILIPGGAPDPAPTVSVQDAISHHHHSSDSHAGGNAGDGFTGFGSSSGWGHGGTGTRYGAEIPIAGSGLEHLRKSEAAAQKKSRWVSIAGAAVIVIFALLFFLLPKDNKFRVNKISIPGTVGVGKQDAGRENSNSRDAGEPERQNSGDAESNKPRGSIDSRQKQQANNYVDSARAPGSALDKQVAFYKIAISFNRYNLQAWHGLLQAYREMKNASEARATETQMSEIFGGEVNTVNAAVTQYGEIIDAYANESGSYRVEYKTKKTSREEIERDVFNLTRAIRNACNCHNISVYASTTGPGKGLIAHSTAATSVYTLPDFKRHASILWFD